MSEKIYDTIWVCQCCLFAHANGECCADAEHGGDGVEPLSQITDGYSVTLGIGWEDHSSDCLTYVVHDLERQYPDMEWPDVPDGYECDCETLTFSRSQCEGCGSYLHGDRYGMTLWGPADTE